MPQLGETVVEGTITKWLKKEGETVDRDEPLFEISTDKVDTEVPSPMAGKVVEIKVPEGETVSVGTELALIEASGNGQAAGGEGQAAAPAQAEAPTEEEEKAEAPQGEAGESEAAQAEEEKPRAEPQPKAEPSPEQPEPAPSPQGDGQAQQAEASTEGGARSQILSPLVRRLAEENDIDLSQVQGTGTGGRITKKDVQTYIESGQRRPAAAAAQQAPAPTAAPTAPQALPTPPSPVGGTEEAVPLSRMRQAIAKNMVASIQTSARAWNLVEVNMENVVRTREAAKESFRQRE